MSEYNHKDIEPKWQQKWEEENLYTTPDRSEKKKFYALTEFPYPSGDLHVGHWYAFSVPDIFARFKRMTGNNVLFPVGFDAFGLPAENAAIKRGLNPREWTYGNIENMRAGLRTIGAMFDWSREVITCDPQYYRWTQWLFLQLLKKGLAYRGELSVNWCPSCKTGLANEQVVNGACERCDTPVEKKHMKQWLLRITDYADRLLADLEELDWPEEIKMSQRNWIGKSDGALIPFDIHGQRVDVFTTRPDTLFGATYMVLAPEHELVQQLKDEIANWDEVEKYIMTAQKRSEIERTAQGKEKTGVKLGGVSAVNPANKEEIPVFIADYVLAHYGTGAIMAVPAHDERDHEFAKKHKLPIVEVVKPEAVGILFQPASAVAHGVQTEVRPKAQIWIGDGILKNSGEFTGMESTEAKDAITKFVNGTKKSTYKLRDWGVSRQRYWGVPIPVIHCPSCGAVPVPEEDLPVVLPEIDDYLPTGDGRSPLAKAAEWKNVPCPQCGKDAERETDTFDTFVDSSWYFLRYIDPQNTKAFADREKLNAWMPIDRYSGGAEHNNMHVLYSRFFHKALFDLGLVPEKEPYTQRMNRGLILGTDGRKMSKRWGNIIEPSKWVDRLGADTVRMYLAFIGPYNEVGSYPWSDDGIIGVRKFLERVWGISKTYTQKNEKVETVLHKTIKKVGEDIERFKFNTAVSQLMICANSMKDGVSPEQFALYLKLLAPFAPHIAEELWHMLGNTQSIHLESWPTYDEALLKEDTVTIAVQVNGKVRAQMDIAADTGEVQVKEQAQALPDIQKWIEDKTIKKTVYVPKRLVNIVV